MQQLVCLNEEAMKKYPTREFENQLEAKGYHMIAGIDEVGRGAWAGPLVAAACVLPKDYASTELCDSKQLTANQREVLASEIQEVALGYGIGQAEPFEIDLFGLTQATQLAFRRALNGLKCTYDYILADGFMVQSSRVPCEGVIKGDEKIFTVAAASVIAKVVRDKMMREMSKDFPGYGFESNVGYGTKDHMKAIQEKGRLAIHRKLFLRNLEALGLPL